MSWCGLFFCTRKKKKGGGGGGRITHWCKGIIVLLQGTGVWRILDPGYESSRKVLGSSGV